MTASTDDEVLKFLSRNEWATGIKTDERYGRHRLFYEDPEANALCLKFPETPLRSTYFARVAAMLGAEDESMFYGALLWITLSDIGSPQLEKTGWAIIEMMRRGFGENRPLEAAPGHWFRNGAVVELAAFLLPCFVFAWDAYVLPSRGDLFIHISHNQNWTVATRTAEAYESSSNDLKSLDPKQASELMLRRFCPSSKYLNRSNAIPEESPS